MGVVRLIAAITLGLSVAGLAACESNADDASAPPTLVALTGSDAVARISFTSDPSWGRPIVGVRITSDGSLELLDVARAPLGPAVPLTFENQFGVGVLVGRSVSLPGANDVVVVARRNPVDPSELSITMLGSKRLSAQATTKGIHPLDDTDPQAVLARKVENRRRRLGYIAMWNDLLSQPTSDARKFADLVQHIVKTNADLYPNDAELAKKHAIDDILDVFVANGHQWEKMLLMSVTESELNPELRPGEGILDPPRHTGFSAVMSKGEGRHRHFACNLGMANQFFGLIPDQVVSLTAQFTGGDFSPEDDSTGDVAADLATNEAGRDFWDFLNEQVQAGKLGDPNAVRSWIIDRFGPPAARPTADVSSIRAENYGTIPHETLYTLFIDNPAAHLLRVTWEGPTCGLSSVPKGNGATSNTIQQPHEFFWSHRHVGSTSCDSIDETSAKITATVQGPGYEIVCTYQGTNPAVVGAPCVKR